jgi:ribosomal protein L10
LIRKELLSNGAHLVIGKNTVINKALDWRVAPLEKDMEDYDFFA